MKDAIVNKITSLQRCVQRARSIYKNKQEKLLSDFDAQDAAIFNIMRACELSIDLANYLIKQNKIGIPTSSAESFDLLAQSQHICARISKDKLPDSNFCHRKRAR